jgi:Uma2 family endonuclease
MSIVLAPNEANPVILRFGSILKRMSDREFLEFCQLNEDLRIELTSDGDLIIMPPTGGETGKRNFNLTTIFGTWVEADGTGVGFDSSTMFTLPNGAKRSPDAAWISRARWDALTKKEREGIPPLCPDFVIELRSPTDNLGQLQAKMQEYLNNGAQLGWLIDPLKKKVYIYRPQMPVECLDQPEILSGEPLLVGFSLTMAKLWQE